jgi:hypothetical protein
MEKRRESSPQLYSAGPPFRPALGGGNALDSPRIRNPKPETRSKTETRNPKLAQPEPKPIKENRGIRGIRGKALLKGFRVFRVFRGSGIEALLRAIQARRSE